MEKGEWEATGIFPARQATKRRPRTLSATHAIKSRGNARCTPWDVHKHAPRRYLPTLISVYGGSKPAALGPGQAFCFRRERTRHAVSTRLLATRLPDRPLEFHAGLMSKCGHFFDIVSKPKIFFCHLFRVSPREQKNICITFTLETDERDVGPDRRLKSHGSLVSKSGHFFDIVSRSIF